MCNTPDKDSVRNASFATLETYEVSYDDIQCCFHGLKVIPKNDTPIAFCIIDTIGKTHKS